MTNRDPYWFIPRMPYWFRRLEYRIPLWLTQATIHRRPPTWMPDCLADLWIVFSQRMFVAYRPGDSRMTSATRNQLDEMIRNHHRKMAEDPAYAEAHRQRWAKISESALQVRS